MFIEQIAKICHEANKAYCAELGDTSHVPWDDAPDWLQDSIRNGVQFNLDKPDAPPSSSHENWLAEKEREGWKYGMVKDAEKKEHPCFVPYEELPVEQQAKDHLFKGIVAAMKPLYDLTHP